MRLHKKLAVLLLAVLTMNTSLLATPIQMTHEGKTITIELDPITSNGTTYIPLRPFCEKMGYKLGWDQGKREAVVTVKDKIIPVPTKVLTQNKQGFIKEDRTYVSSEWIEKNFGLTVLKPSVGELGVKVVDLLAAGKYNEVIGMMDEVSAKMIDENILKQTWETMPQSFGAVQSYALDQVTSVEGGYKQVDVKIICEKAHIKATSVFNEKSQLSGFRINIYTKEAKLPEGVVEKDMVVQTGAYKLPATLTLPKGEGQFPVVVLVHGSGPNDRDESIGGVKVFRDIAYGLAEQGIATLRYDKRTFVHMQEYMANPALFNYEEEVLDDALSAVELMKNTPQIDKDNIYVLGHSLGAMSVPILSTKDEGVAGYIMVAGPARNLVDVVLEQVEYLAEVQGMPKAQKALYMQMMKTQAETVRKLTLDEKVPEIGFIGFNNSMWAAFNAYDQVEVAKGMTDPLFIVQGGRDYQVTMADFKIWQDALKGKDNVTLKDYPDLNHILITGEGKSVPDEYYMPNEVSKTFIKDIGNWVLEQSK